MQYFLKKYQFVKKTKQFCIQKLCSNCVDLNTRQQQRRLRNPTRNEILLLIRKPQNFEKIFLRNIEKYVEFWR